MSNSDGDWWSWISMGRSGCIKISSVDKAVISKAKFRPCRVGLVDAVVAAFGALVAGDIEGRNPFLC